MPGGSSPGTPAAAAAGSPARPAREAGFLDLGTTAGSSPKHSPKVQHADGANAGDDRVVSVVDEVKLLRERMASPWLINPHAPAMRRWDGATTLALLFTASITPYEVAFLETDPDEYPVLFVANRVVDVLFLCDVVLQFFLCYEEQDPTQGLRMVKDQRKIAERYVKSWFVLDVLSCLPIDVVSYYFESEELEDFKIMRVIRLFRLIKLSRVLRAPRILQRWEAEFALPSAYVKIVKLGVMLFVGSHWMACMFGMVGVMNLDDILQSQAYQDADDLYPVGSWIAALAVSKPGFEIGLNAPPDSSGRKRLNGDFSPRAVYLSALYYAIATITSIGYGDVTPQNMNEMLFAVGCMFIGGILWAFCLGSFCGIVATLDPDTAAHNQTLDAANRMMVDRHLPREMRHKIRRFFMQSRALRTSQSYLSLLGQLSPMLQREVARESNSRWLAHVMWLQGVSEDFVCMVARRMVPLMFSGGEHIPNKISTLLKEIVLPLELRFKDHPMCMYVLARGVCTFSGQVLTIGAAWHTDCLLSNADLRRETQAVALTYVEAACLPVPILLDILEEFPMDYWLIRRANIFLALDRGMRRFAKIAKELEIELPASAYDIVEAVQNFSSGKTERRTSLLLMSAKKTREGPRRLSNPNLNLSLSAQNTQTSSAPCTSRFAAVCAVELQQS
jgi:hypothetical protein